MTTGLKIIFMGTPDFSVGALRALIESSHDVVAVYTQPPRPAGRGHSIKKSPVHQVAEENDVPVVTPQSLKQEAEQKEFSDFQADLAVVAAYGLILPQAVLGAPRYGCVNIHASILPRWRGAAPIQRAIMAGDDQTGISIMQMEVGLDTGPVMMEKTVPVTKETTASSLHDSLAMLGADMIVPAVDRIAENTAVFEPQDETKATYAHKLVKEEGEINWKEPAVSLDRMVRALNPWPGVWCELPDGKKLKVQKASVVTDQTGQSGTILSKELLIACGNESLKLETVQPESKKPMSGESFLNGSILKVGERFVV